MFVFRDVAVKLTGRTPESIHYRTVDKCFSEKRPRVEIVPLKFGGQIAKLR